MARPYDLINAGEQAHRRLFASVAALDDAGVRRPSLLPGWSRAHVISHLARNADSHVRLFEGAAAGEVRVQYSTHDERDAQIESGAHGTARALREDLHAACERLESAWRELRDDYWEREGVVVAGHRTMSEIVFRRLREVEVHHVDLDLDYEPSQWAPIYIEGELSRRLPALPDRASHVALVTWLLGRSDAPELESW